MNQSLINRYQPGGDIYAALQDDYGTPVANAAADAAQTGNSHAITEIIAQARNGALRQTSVAAIFADQLATDPLNAPIGAANNIIGNTFFALLKNPWVIALTVGALFYALGGFQWARKKINA